MKNYTTSIFLLGFIFAICSASSCYGVYKKNDDAHLVSVLDPMDFCLESIVAVPNNACLQQLLRFGYVQSIFLLATEHKLGESKNLSIAEKQALLVAKSTFQKALRPFLAGYPIANSMFGTTELWQELEEQRRTYQMMP